MKSEQLTNEMVYDYRKEHKAVYQSWNKNAIKITYVGAQVSATAEVKANTLELAAPALTVVYNIDLTSASYNTLSKLVAYINGLADWECELGSQFDGTEASASLTIIAATDVKTAGVWFVQDTNLQIKIVIPTVATGKKITVTKVLGNVTGTGASSFEFTKGSTLVWYEAAGATTVEKASTLPNLDGAVGEQITLKIKMATTLTAGYLTVGYDEKMADSTVINV
jgi:hypothetical protein